MGVLKGRKGIFFLLAIGILALIPILVACTGPQGAAGPQGDTGAQGLQGIQGNPPSEEAVRAIVEEVLAGPEIPAASIAGGGRLYDKWWTAAGVSSPSGNQPLWALQTTNANTGTTTWRCKECHGWDYKGKGGAYRSGSHYTGFVGVYKAATTMTTEQLVDILQGATDYRHDFSAVLSEESIADLANFLKAGMINETKYIDYAVKTPIGADGSHGEVLFSTVCAACHGTDGTAINFGSAEEPEYVGTVAVENPWEFLNKVRFGQPGTAMPSGVENGWSIQDVVDVLGHSQTLPTQ